MSYESKYLKYKLKYLKLSLKIQKGGVEHISISWPKDYEKIREDDMLMIEDFGNLDIYGLNSEEISFLRNQRNIIGNVKMVNKNKLELINLTSSGAKLGKIVFTGEENNDNNIYFRKIMTENNEIENQIKELEKKYNELENKLENHYHILPTSGIKIFEKMHPYYNKKID